MNRLSWWFSLETTWKQVEIHQAAEKGFGKKCVSAAMIGSTLVDIAGGLEIKQQRNSFTVRAQEILTR